MANYLFALMITVPVAVRCLTFTTNGSTDGNNSFECHTNVSLVCQTQNRRDYMILAINNTQLVNCVTRCFVNTALLGKYIATHDFDAGFIRLDIPAITDADASNKFTCSGDSTSLSIKPIIQVFPEKSSTKLIIKETNSTKMVEIKALTGCVLLKTNLTFVWNKTRYSNGTGLEPLPDEGFIIKNTDSTEDSNCIPSDHCGGQARSSALEFTEETSGGVDYYISCTIVINENVSENKQRNYTVITERTFAIKEPNENVLKSDPNYFPLLGLIAIAALIILVIYLVYMKKRAPRLESKTETSATFTWITGCFCYGHDFRICYKSLQNEKASLIEQKVKKPPGTILNLQPGCTYQCYVYAMTGTRKSNNSTSVVFTTLGLPDAPTDLQAVHDTITETSVTLKWKPGNYRKYRQKFVLLYLRKDHGNLEWTDVVLEDDLKPTTFYKVENLKEGTSYEFKVKAKNEIGESDASAILFVETRGKPESPSDLREVKSKRTSNTMTVSWKPGTYGRDTQKFVINYKRRGSKTWKHKHLDDDGNSSKITFEIDDLIPGNYYLIAINATNHTRRTSGMSNTITVTTIEWLPQPPTEFVCSSVTETEVQLSWKPVIYKQKQSFYLTYTNGRDQYTEVIPFDINKTKVEHSVSNLSPGTVYKFSILAFFGKLNERKISECCVILITTKEKSTEWDTESLETINMIEVKSYTNQNHHTIGADE